LSGISFQDFDIRSTIIDANILFILPRSVNIHCWHTDHVLRKKLFIFIPPKMKQLKIKRSCAVAPLLMLRTCNVLKFLCYIQGGSYLC
jgi:hypothetical protein